MPDRLKSLLAWVVSPATDPGNRPQAVAGAAVRIAVGVMWLTNAGWKTPPTFGQADGSGLFAFTSDAIAHPVFPPFSFAIEHLVLPVFPAFGWGVLLAESALAVMMLSGSWVRIAALLGIAQSLAIGMSVANTPNEWPWSYLLMIAVHAVLLVLPAGRILGVDGVRAGATSARTLHRVWAIVIVIIGVAAVLISLGHPLAGRAAAVQVFSEVRFGEYNVPGGVVLIVIGVLLAVLGWAGTKPAALAVIALGTVAALLVYVQLSAGAGSVLGGTPSSAALFWTCVAVASAAMISPPGDARQRPEPVATRRTARRSR